MIEAITEKIGRVLERPDRLRIAMLVRLAAVMGVDIETRVRLITGHEMTVLLPDVVSTCLAYDGVFEPEVQIMIARELPRGGTFIDVGAHFGACSLMAVSFGASRVMAFEPAPKNLRILRKNCAGLRGITVVDRAISDQSDVKLKMRIFGTRHCASNTLANPRLPERVIKASPTQEVEVETVTIDDYVANQGIGPDVIKVDVENHTGRALAGARRTLAKYHPAVIVEVGGYGSSAKNDLEVLRNLGYCFYRWVNTDFEPDHLVANDERNILAIHASLK